MENAITVNRTKMRNSSVELLKIFAIVLVVLNHVIQTLHSNNSFITSTDYLLPLSNSTTDIQLLILSMLRYSGNLGNFIFLVCSVWFLLDSTKSNKQKMLQMILDVWIISVSILSVVLISRHGNIDKGLILKSIFPTLFSNNWYITCYIILYLIHPILNKVIHSVSKRTLLRLTLIMLFIYVGVNFVSQFFFDSMILLWITIYFTVGYMKLYMSDFVKNKRINAILLAFGLIGGSGIILATNFLGLKIGFLSDKLLHWNTSYNPFVIIIAIALINLANSVHFENKAINYVSKLSLLIYIFHENLLLRTYYRPMLWQYIYENFGYNYALLWALALTAIIFALSLIVSVLYKETIQKIVAYISSKLIMKAKKYCHRIENVLLKIK